MCIGREKEIREKMWQYMPLLKEEAMESQIIYENL